MSNQNRQDEGDRDDFAQYDEDHADTDIVIPPDSLSKPPSNEIIPSPRAFREYEDILPGSMDRILSMAKNN